MKATSAEQCRALEHTPNIGPALAADLGLLDSRISLLLQVEDLLRTDRAMPV